MRQGIPFGVSLFCYNHPVTIMQNNPDAAIVSALLCRDKEVTVDFLYRRCYPLFKAVYNNYHTDCSTCVEFINEIYLHILTPDPVTGVCKLEKFRFESTLFTWLKTVCVFYCYHRYARMLKSPAIEADNYFADGGVRLEYDGGSVNTDDFFMPGDADTILRLMPNRRYSMLIRLRYLEGYTNEETAVKLGMNMNTYYNKHKCAKEQFMKTLRKEEGRYGYGQ